MEGPVPGASRPDSPNGEPTADRAPPRPAGDDSTATRPVPSAAARSRRHRRLAIVFFVVYAIAVTYPGVLPFNRARPFVLGLPFSMVWVTLWIVLGGVVFRLLERATPRDGA